MKIWFNVMNSLNFWTCCKVIQNFLFVFYCLRTFMFFYLFVQYILIIILQHQYVKYIYMLSIPVLDSYYAIFHIQLFIKLFCVLVKMLINNENGVVTDIVNYMQVMSYNCSVNKYCYLEHLNNSCPKNIVNEMLTNTFAVQRAIVVWYHGYWCIS